MSTYRDDDLALRAELKAVERELQAARAALDTVARRVRPLQTQAERWSRLRRARWQAVCGMAAFLLVVSGAYGYAAAERSHREQLRYDAREPLVTFPHARVDRGKTPRLLAMLEVMSALDAAKERQAWEIVAGAACMRGDLALYERAKLASGQVGDTPVSRACWNLETPSER